MKIMYIVSFINTNINSFAEVSFDTFNEAKEYVDKIKLDSDIDDIELRNDGFHPGLKF